MAVYRASKNYDVPNLDLLTLLFESPGSLGEESALIHCSAANPSNAYTKAEGRSSAKRFAHTMRKTFGIGATGPGKDVVTVISSGQYYLPVAFYGVLAAGGVYSAASSAMTAAELARQVQDGGSDLIISSRDVIAVAKEAARECGIPMNRVLLLESEPRWQLIAVDGSQNLVGQEELDWEKVTDQRILETRPITLLYSSGTTGVPKGVPLSNRNMVAASFLTSSIIREYLAQRKEAGDPPFEWRTIAHLPAAHIAGAQGYFVNPLYQGGLVYWMEKFDFPKFLDYNQRFRITFFFTVPPIFLAIAKTSIVRDQFKALRSVISGAAPMGRELQRESSAKLGDENTYVSQTWGLSETTGSSTFLPWDRHDFSGSVGPLLPNMAMRLVDDDGVDVKEGQSGEILIKGPVVFKGYHNNPRATAEAFKDGWFCTGDIGEIRDELVYIVDRKKELIKYKGLQVAPAELEALLITNPLIADAAVIGVPGFNTEVPRAYVVADRNKISENDIKDYVRKKAASHKQLRGGVVFVEAIPKSPAGKILRKNLKELREKEVRAKL